VETTSISTRIPGALHCQEILESTYREFFGSYRHKLEEF
jgi:hypothetical protein